MGREGIEVTGLILPGRSGRVYVTPDEYDSSQEAADRLSLPRLPSGFYEVPEKKLEDVSEPQTVGAHHGRPGGGIEQYVEYPVDASDLKWVTL